MLHNTLQIVVKKGTQVCKNNNLRVLPDDPAAPSALRAGTVVGCCTVPRVPFYDDSRLAPAAARRAVDGEIKLSPREKMLDAASPPTVS